MTDEQKAKCHKIAEYYGEEHQMLKAVEEMAELQVELMKFVNSDGGDLDRIFEEIADTCIMIEQLRYLFGKHDSLYCNDSEIESFINAKLDRQLKRMESENDA